MKLGKSLQTKNNGVLEVAKDIGKGIGVVVAPPAVIAVDAFEWLGQLSTRNIHIANQYDSPVSAIIAPNEDWVVADLASLVVQLAITMGEDAPAGLSALTKASSLMDVYNATGALRDAEGIVAKLWTGFFSKRGCVVKPGGADCVTTRSNSNPLDYMDPSQIGTAFFDASDFTIYLQAEDGRSVMFNTNSDRSWIIGGLGATRAKHGSIWDPDDFGDIKLWRG